MGRRAQHGADGRCLEKGFSYFIQDPPPPCHHDQAFMVWNFGDVLGCVVMLVLIKLLIVAMVMKSFGFSWEASTLAGACMAQVRRCQQGRCIAFRGFGVW